MLRSRVIVDGFQTVIVQDVVSENGIPITGTQAIIAKMPVATFKADVDVHHTMDGKCLLNGVELYRTETKVDDVDASQLLRFSGTVGLGGIKAVVGIYLGLLVERSFRLIFALTSDGWGYVDALHVFVTICAYFYDSFCALRNGNETVESGQGGK